MSRSSALPSTPAWRAIVAPAVICFLLVVAEIAAIYGFMRSVVDYLGFGTTSARSIFFIVIGCSIAFGLSLLLKRAIPKRWIEVDQADVRITIWVLGNLLLVVSALTFATWRIGSPLDPIRFPSALSVGLAGGWIGLIGAGIPFRKRVFAWNGLLLLSIACTLFMSLGLRAKSVDGYGRPIMAWSWQKNAASAKIAEASSQLNESDRETIETTSLDPLAELWPQLMGKHRDGHASAMFRSREEIQSERLKLQWEIAIGPSWSSCVCNGNALFTQESKGGKEILTAFRLIDGKRLWESSLNEAYTSNIGGDGSRATPTLSNDLVVAFSANGQLVCCKQQTGEVVWSRNTLEETSGERPEHGLCGSPLIIDDRVYVFAGSKPGFALLAYDLRSGERKAQGGNEIPSYASLSLRTIEQTPIIIAPGRTKTQGFSLDLVELWSIDFTNSTNTICSQAQPLANGDLLLTAAYGTGSKRLRLRPSPDPKGSWTVEEVWKSRHLRCNFSSAVVRNEKAFGLDEGILQCVDLRNGTSLWKKPRYGHGQLLLCDDILVVQCEDGSLAFVDADAEGFTELLRVPQLESKTWNHPVWAAPFLILRNDSRMRCLRIE